MIIHNICIVFREAFVILQNIALAYLGFSRDTFWLSHVTATFYVLLTNEPSFNHVLGSQTLRRTPCFLSHFLIVQKINCVEGAFFRAAGGKVSKYPAVLVAGFGARPAKYNFWPVRSVKDWSVTSPFMLNWKISPLCSQYFISKASLTSHVPMPGNISPAIFLCFFPLKAWMW